MHCYCIEYICNIIVLVIQFKSLIKKNKNDKLILIFKTSFHENNNIIIYI